MKLNIKNIHIPAICLAIAVGAVSCEDQPDKFKLTSGVPVVKYVRVIDPEKSDSLITSAYMDNQICLVGDNLTSIKEIYFNDRKALLNTSLITEHTLLVTVPGDLPGVVTNKMYMITAGKDTVDYDFGVIVPGPSVRSMSCEFANPGDEVTLIGDYFIDDPGTPLTIMMGGSVPVNDIKSIDKTRIRFIVPEGAQPGYINVSTIYGTGRSAFKFHDTDNILFDWDGNGDALAAGWGWRDGSKLIHEPGSDSWPAIDGNYIVFAGSMGGDAGATWDEDSFSFNYWPDPSGGHPALSSLPGFAKMLENYDLSKLQVKFEALVPASNPWSASALQIIFSGDNTVTYATAGNGYFSDTSVPRGLWIPWQLAGSYDTAGQWTTIALPLSSFNYTYEGNACGTSLSKNDFTGLTFFLWNGGVNGTDCEPVICIDNIRVVPIE